MAKQYGFYGKYGTKNPQSPNYNSTMDFISNLQASREEANKANQARLNEALGYYDQLINMFSPGGGYGKGLEASLELGFKRARASAVQGLTTSGLANTQMMAGAGQSYEEQVANPARTKLEMDRFNKLAAAYTGKAGVLERVQDEGPSDAEIEAWKYGVDGAGSGGGGGGVTYATKPGSKLDAWMDYARNKGTSSGGGGSKPSAVQRVVDVMGHYSTGEGKDSAYTKGFKIPTTYKNLKNGLVV
jgi:hypothetical protein